MNNQPPTVINLNLPKPPWRLIGFLAVAVLVFVVIWSSYYTVPAESEAVVLRFGRFLTIAEPGLHFKIPLGVDEYTLVQTRRQLKLEFGFSTAGATNSLWVPPIHCVCRQFYCVCRQFRHGRA